jgi:hypothetical protein
MFTFVCQTKRIFLILVLSLLPTLSAFSQLIDSSSAGQKGAQVDVQEPAKEKKWYDSFAIRGYSQIRYNRLLETNPDLKCDQCDKSWGDNGGFFMRRMRIILFGNVHERVYVYIQPDFASSASATGLHFGQIRDAYFDVSLDKKKEFRLRFGQSKVPFGFENMQSSQNRLALDRNDALNSAVSNERDMGIFFFWAPKKIRERFSYLVSSGLKGSGDYGVFAFGAYNGQTANKPEENNEPHIVSRLTYPFQFGSKQIVEVGAMAYSGKTVVSSVTKGVKTLNDENQYLDQRAGATLVLYPQPIGFTAEYNVGTGPEYNPTTNSIDQKELEGGYALLNARIKMGKQDLFPFARYQYYKGGKKFEQDARKYRVNEFEIGAEWQPVKNFELVAMYTISERRFEDAAKTNNLQIGNLLRLQAQVNF